MAYNPFRETTFEVKFPEVFGHIPSVLELTDQQGIHDSSLSLQPSFNCSGLLTVAPWSAVFLIATC